MVPKSHRTINRRGECHKGIAYLCVNIDMTMKDR